MVTNTYPPPPPIAPPQPPESRIEYRGFLTFFIGPKSLFEQWRKLPWWKRVLASGVYR